MTFVTTSWDDGHPLDFRVAELLDRHRIPGTFYIPRECEGREVIAGPGIRALSQNFEAGAHTIRHHPLPALSATEAAEEIGGSRRYIEDASGRECRVFAPPGGYFRREHLAMAARAGLRGFRTAELLNCGPPQRQSGLTVIPTTLQLYSHTAASYCRNALKRLRPGNLVTFMRHAAGGNLERTFTSLLGNTIARGGVLHLWGHSWEIEEQGDWHVLEFMLARIAEHRENLSFGPNSALCSTEAK
jgi:peptidoglycan/xylan/chitin deacetylase (PgdA/CDA1 family)